MLNQDKMRKKTQGTILFICENSRWRDATALEVMARGRQWPEEGVAGVKVSEDSSHLLNYGLLIDPAGQCAQRHWAVYFMFVYCLPFCYALI